MIRATSFLFAVVAPCAALGCSKPADSQLTGISAAPAAPSPIGKR